MGALVTGAEAAVPAAELASQAAATMGAPTETVASTAADLLMAPPMAAVMAMVAGGARLEDHLRHAKADRGPGLQKAKAFVTPLPAGTDSNDPATALGERDDPSAPGWLAEPRAADPRPEDRKAQVSLDVPVRKLHIPRLPMVNGIPLEQPTVLLHRSLPQGLDRHWLQMPIP